MNSYNDELRNVFDWGPLKVGDTVEYVRMYAESGSLDHGHTTITYKCNAYLELSNGDVVDGYVDSDAAYCGLIVGGKCIPCPPMAYVLKKSLKKLQNGGRSLAEPYQRVMSILGDAVGLALVEDKGAFHFKPHHAYQKANRKGASTIKYKPTIISLSQDDYAQGTRFTTSWKDKSKETWKAHLRRQAMVALEPPIHWHEHGDIRDVLTGLGE